MGELRPASSLRRSLSGLEAIVRRELPHLEQAEVADLSRSVARIVEAFEPEEIYVFGSHARGMAHINSDMDLLVLVRLSNEPPYRRAQRAYAAVEAHSVPLDIHVMTLDEFHARLPAVASLPATIAREGRSLYAASGPA